MFGLFSTLGIAPFSSAGCVVSLGAFFPFDVAGTTGLCRLLGACAPPVRSFGCGAGCCERLPETIKPIDKGIEKRTVIVGRSDFIACPLMGGCFAWFPSCYFRLSTHIYARLPEEVQFEPRS